MSKARYVRRCATCGGEFKAVRETARFCQPRCQRFERTCEDCGASFTARSGRSKRCDNCAGEWRRARRHERHVRPTRGTAFAPVKVKTGGSRAKRRLEEARQHRHADIDLALRSRTDGVVRAYRERQLA